MKRGIASDHHARHRWVNVPGEPVLMVAKPNEAHEFGNTGFAFRTKQHSSADGGLEKLTAVIHGEPHNTGSQSDAGATIALARLL
jgi:hypothetical protein